MNRVYQRLVFAAQALRYGEVPPTMVNHHGQISNEEILEIKRFFPMEKYFIFGHARSGTTLLARLIRVHPEVHCNWQAHFFTRRPFLSSLVSDPEVNEWLTRRSNRWNRGQDLSPIVMRAVSDFILEREAARVGKTVVGDKSPNNLVHGKAVQLLTEIYPDAKLIFIVRDGRDAVISHQIQKFIDLPDQLNAEEITIRQSLIKDPQGFLIKNKTLFPSGSLQKAADDWVKNVTETNDIGKGIYAESFLSLRFEDIVDNPHIQLDRIWKFLGVNTEIPELEESINNELSENPDADWQREKQQEVAKIIRKGLPGSWREIFTEEDKRIFKEFAGETLVDWGYEKDLNW